MGFRYFVLKEASSLGVTGYVRNSTAGDEVEVIAFGNPRSLDELVSRLRKGPESAHVTAVETRPIAPAAVYHDFTIHY